MRRTRCLSKHPWRRASLVATLRRERCSAALLGSFCDNFRVANCPGARGKASNLRRFTLNSGLLILTAVS
jgi:hypothetical protein